MNFEYFLHTNLTVIIKIISLLIATILSIIGIVIKLMANKPKIKVTDLFCACHYHDEEESWACIVLRLENIKISDGHLANVWLQFGNRRYDMTSHGVSQILPFLYGNFDNEKPLNRVKVVPIDSTYIFVGNSPTKKNMGFYFAEFIKSTRSLKAKLFIDITNQRTIRKSIKLKYLD